MSKLSATNYHLFFEILSVYLKSLFLELNHVLYKYLNSALSKPLLIIIPSMWLKASLNHLNDPLTNHNCNSFASNGWTFAFT